MSVLSSETEWLLNTSITYYFISMVFIFEENDAMMRTIASAISIRLMDEYGGKYRYSASVIPEK